MATLVAGALAKGSSPNELGALRSSSHPAQPRVVAEMSKEWANGKQMVAGKDFVYSKAVGKYCAVHAGRANPNAWSLALECRNFQDGFGRVIRFQERLFVTSRPRVFRKYFRILGLTGSIGSKPEQEFLRNTYGAVSFKVPPFLTVCRGSPFHEAVPVRLGQRRRTVYVEPTPEAHLIRLAEVALDARDRVPVLVIARDRAHADHLVERLRAVARSRGLGALSDDVVRSLSRTLYEANPEQWKENLNRSTLALGEGDGAGRSWRVTVTDPRGGRGTDYRVDDKTVDAHGGLLLIPTLVPTSRREWTQFLGRTARQDCRGQFCCVLCAADYVGMSKKYNEALPADGVDGGSAVIETILRWGDRETTERIQGTAALYNTGVRMNELCEEVFSRRSHILSDPSAREYLVEACQRLRWMSTREVDQSFGQLPDFDPTKVATEARDCGRPEEPLVSTVVRGVSRSGQAHSPNPPKVIVFCLDWSASMMSQDCGTRLSRFETCVACILRILREKVRDCDYVGVVGFGPNVQLVLPPTLKGQGRGVVEDQIASLRPQRNGGTCFFDAVTHCLQLLIQPGSAPSDASQWLVCLTDGDDLGSRPQNARGELATQMIAAGVAKNLNMLMVTVGALKQANVQVIQGWVQSVCTAGGVGQLLSERDAATIARAFDVVAEHLGAEVGGAVEC